MAARRKTATKKDLRPMRKALEEAMAEIPERKPAKKAKPANLSLAEWEAQASAFREQLDLDFRDPRAFSRYLLAVYGPKSDPKWQKLLKDQLWDTETPEKDWSKAYKHRFDAYFRALAPKGLQACRGLHHLAFLPQDDIAGMIFRRREGGEQNYSQNAAIAPWMFSTQYLHKDFLTAEPLLVRGLLARDSSWSREDIENRTFREEGEDDEPPRRQPKGAPKRPERRAFSTKEHQRILAALQQVHTPCVLVTNLDRQGVFGFGGDSESGDTLEAEIKVTYCEPQCLAHLFVASTAPLGTPVPEDQRAFHALDEHFELEGEYHEFGSATPVTLYLHPQVDLGPLARKAKRIKHLPPGFAWYEVDVSK